MTVEIHGSLEEIAEYIKNMPKEKVRPPERPKLYTRRFLNAKEGTAFVECSFEHDDYYDHKDMRGVYGHVKLADCNRMINLEFYYDSEESYHQRLTKIKDLEESLKEVRIWMENSPPEKKPEPLKKKNK